MFVVAIVVVVGRLYIPEFLICFVCDAQEELAKLNALTCDTEGERGVALEAEAVTNCPRNTSVGVAGLRNHSSAIGKSPKSGDGHIKNLAAQRRAAIAKVNRLSGQLETLKASSVGIADMVRSILIHVRYGIPDDLDELLGVDGDDADLKRARDDVIKQVREQSQPGTALGGMIDVFLCRTQSGNLSSAFPPVLINLAMMLQAYSPKAFNLLRAVVPNALPSLSTIKRRRSLGDPLTFGINDKTIIHLVTNADSLGIPLDCREGFLQSDEVSLQGVR